MLLKLGIAMTILSLALAAGVAFAVAGSRNEAPAMTAVSSAEPQTAETTVQKREFNSGEKLEIDHGTGGEPAPGADKGKRSAPADPAPAAPAESALAAGAPEGSTSGGPVWEDSASGGPAPKSRPKPLPLPESTDWPRPAGDELTTADEPRYFDQDPSAEMTLTVEALGLYDVPVISSDDISALDTSLMHVPETSFPWDGGAQRNVYIAGHYLGYPGTDSRLVFYNLDKLKNDDEVDLKDRDGRVYRYRVSESFTADPDESWVMGQEINRDMVTLQTCIPPDFSQRLIVRADRV